MEGLPRESARSCGKRTPRPEGGRHGGSYAALAQGFWTALPQDGGCRGAQHGYPCCRHCTCRGPYFSERQRSADQASRVRLKFWWLTDFTRLGQEKASVEDLVKEGWFQIEAWRAIGKQLTVFGTITAGGTPYPIRLVYPDQFPAVPAWVAPQESVKWSNHQFGEGGSLCLELRPDNWVTTYTGADVL